MVGYIEESKGGDYKPTPEGQHTMIGARVIDLGTQKTDFNGEVKYQRKVLIGWELPEVRVEVDGKNLPALHYEKYTWSFHEKANLRAMLESWRGKRFREEDFAGPPNGFHIKKVLGVPCIGQIMHEVGKTGKTYANLSSVMAFPGKPDTWPKLEGEAMFLDLDNFDDATFGKLSEYWQKTIMATEEYMVASGQMKPHAANQAAREMVDDEIPF
jgi:hypothetical protein